MGLFDKIAKAASHKISDEVSAVEATLNGDPGQFIAENTLGILDGSETGNILQREAGDIFDFAIDTAQGEDVGLEYDPEVIGEIETALPGDIEDGLGTFLDMF